MREHQRVRRRTDGQDERETTGRGPQRGSSGDGDASERSTGEGASETARTGEERTEEAPRVRQERGKFVLARLRDDGRGSRLSHQPEARSDPQHVVNQQREAVVLPPEPTYAELQARAGDPIRVPVEPTYRELQARSERELVGWWKPWIDRAGESEARRSPSSFPGWPRDGPISGGSQDDGGDAGGPDGDGGGDGLVPP